MSNRVEVHICDNEYTCSTDVDVMNCSNVQVVRASASMFIHAGSDNKVRFSVPRGTIGAHGYNGTVLRIAPAEGAE